AVVPALHARERLVQLTQLADVAPGLGIVGVHHQRSGRLVARIRRLASDRGEAVAARPGHTAAYLACELLATAVDQGVELIALGICQRHFATPSFRQEALLTRVRSLQLTQVKRCVALQ